MLSKAIKFALQFLNSRRLSEEEASAVVDPAAEDFQAQLKAAVAAALAAELEASHILVETTSDRTVLDVTVTHFGNATAAELITIASSSTFLTQLESRTGATSIAMHTAPALIWRTTDVPSPPPTPPAPPPIPPSTPPSSPPAPPSVPTTPISPLTTLDGSDDSLANTATTTGALSQETIYIIVVAAAVVSVLLAVACVVYCITKRAQERRKSTVVQVGRPALRRQITPEQEPPAGKDVAPPPSRSHSDAEEGIANVSLQDVRLIELGMAVERQLTGGAGPSSSASKLATKLDVVSEAMADVQHTIEQVRESISPRSPSQIVDTRIRASAKLEPEKI